MMVKRGYEGPYHEHLETSDIRITGANGATVSPNLIPVLSATSYMVDFQG